MNLSMSSLNLSGTTQHSAPSLSASQIFNSVFGDARRLLASDMSLALSLQSLLPGLLVALIIGAYTCSVIQLQVLGPKAPLVGSSSWLLPRFFANLNLFHGCRKILDEGFTKYKNRPFWFARNDADMIVLPNRYIEEIRALPSEIANPKEAHIHNLLGWLTNMDLILRNDLHFRVIQNKLTPMLTSLAEPVQDELTNSLHTEFPDCGSEAWVPFHPYHTILSVVAGISARVFVGLPFCRDSKWLQVSTQFTENVFKSLLILRTFPVWTHRLIYLALPTIWKNKLFIRQAQRLLVPQIRRYQATMEKGRVPLEEQTLLSSMVETATAAESDPYDLAHLVVIVSLASIHTTQMNVVHCLYDLAAHPEYMDPLRQEISDVANAPGGWNKTSYSKLRKLDSFIKESQRFNPPSLLSYHRIIREKYQLMDGTVLPKGAHVCMPVAHIQAETIADSEVFDGFRYERQRNIPGAGHLHQFTTTAPTSLNFGHGKYACPGRFFASLEIKSILARLIMEYDFKFMDGGHRPENLHAYEFIFPDPDARLLVRKRDESSTLGHPVLQMKNPKAAGVSEEITLG